jgi:hypothetical protein
MRVAVFCAATLASLTTSASVAASTTHTSAGVLRGNTRISTACPVPSHLCKAWSPYPYARFTVTRLDATGAALAHSRRIVESNADALFRIRLRPGHYVVDPLPANRRTGPRLRLNLQPHTTKTLTIRFAAHRR